MNFIKVGVFNANFLFFRVLRYFDVDLDKTYFDYEFFILISFFCNFFVFLIKSIVLLL